MSDVLEELSTHEQEALVELAKTATDDSGDVTRRDLLQAAGVLGVGGLVGAAGSQAIGTAEAATNQSGTIGSQSNLVDIVAEDITVDTSIEVETGPIVHSSGHASIQAALDAAAGGHLIINDTKTEENIQFDAVHDGTTVEWVGDNWIEQPASPTSGQSVIDLAAVGGLVSEGVTLIRPRIRNPNLNDGDINNEDTQSESTNTGAIELASPDTRAAVGGTNPRPKDWTVIHPHIHHVQGFGIRFFLNQGVCSVEGGEIYRTAYDSIYFGESAAGTRAIASNVDCGWSGRHNVGVAKDANENYVHITGHMKDAFSAGIDLEDAARAHLDATVENSGRSGGAAGVDSGLNVSANSDEVGGHVHVIDPNARAAQLSGAHFNDLTVSWEQSAAENPAGEEAVLITGGASGTVHVNGTGGGSSFALFIDNANDQLTCHANIREAYGASVLVFNGGSPAPVLHLHSIDPVQGTSTNIAAQYRCHVQTDGGLQNLVCYIRGVDNDGNVEDAILSDGNGDDYNRYFGNVRGGYSTNATAGLGANSQADLIT